MPQMGPMSWLLLFCFISLIYMVFLISVYFTNYSEGSASPTLNLTASNFTWLW